MRGIICQDFAVKATTREEVVAEEVEDSEETVGEMVEAVWKENNLEEAWELWIGTV